MKKKIIIITAALALLLPGFSVLASGTYLNGYLDTMPFTIEGTSGQYSSSTIKRFYDNDPSSFTNIPKSTAPSTEHPKITFEKPVNITSFHVTKSYTTALLVKLYNSAGTLVSSKNLGDGSTLFSADDIKVIQLVSSDGTYATTIAEFDVFGNTVTYQPVSNLTETHTFNSISLSWKNPIDTNYSSILIKKDGVQIAELPKTGTAYKINGLTPETPYKVEVIAKYTDGKTAIPVSVNVKTDREPPPPPKPAGEIVDLSAGAKFNRVDLSWTLPKSENFKHVNIYRNVIQKTALIDVLMGTRTVYAASTKIFETNGTYFNDLTVKPETTYEYTLTTQSVEGLESKGITEVVTTPKEPTPEIVGGQFEKDQETGEYTYKWTKPTTGKVEVYIGGRIYKTVNAADQQIIIPAADMKFNTAGVPQVQLKPISESGKEGVLIQPPSSTGGDGGIIDSVKVPFGANDLLGAGTGLLWVIGPFVLLALAFLLVPKLRALIVNAFSKKNDKEISPRRSTGDITERTRESKEHREQREQREKREREERVRLNEKTVDFKNDSREKVIVKAERMPKERRIKEPKPSRVPRERVRRARTPRPTRLGRERS